MTGEVHRPGFCYVLVYRYTKDLWAAWVGRRRLFDIEIWLVKVGVYRTFVG